MVQAGVAKKFHIPEIIIGLTIVSVGTSMPELFVSITSALEGYADMSIGNVIGSNLCNLLLILGVSTIIKPIVFQEETKKYEIPLALVVTVILLIFCNTGSGISRIEGIILIILFVLFISYTIVMGKKGQEETLLEISEDDQKNNSTLKNVIFIVLGIIGLKVGGDLVVDNSKIIANYFNVSEKIISLTIVALGTSLPELVTSVTAAIKGNSDVAIGNIIGSNLFNILLILGVSSIISPIAYNISYNLDLILLILATIMLAIFPYIPPKDKMGRVNGLVYFVMYIAYMGVLIFK